MVNWLSVLQVVNVTGNQDICFYNFLCAHPLGALRCVVSICLSRCPNALLQPEYGEKTLKTLLY